ncbi:potassium channel family protein [Desnuesiella massiliensis]|uniref:potassium channel family protein n=1 Tax=Desnuesiella massiliensis TaxID=1650662 RepID=UPI0006E2B7C9|nr:NAD-binding protein [Desnuesiella massiliensis]
MRAVIVGGGKVGYYLLKTLKETGYEVSLIEKDIEVCNKIAEDFDADIICGDGTNIEVLTEAGIESSEVIAAVTGKDAENFVICKMIKTNFDIRKTIARINNPKNREVFKALGISDTVCSTEVIANIIDSELNNDRVKLVQTLDRGEIILVEANVDRKSVLKNKLLSNINIPEGCLIVSIFRGNSIIYPNGSIKILEGDRLLMTIPSNKRNELEACL